MSKELKQGDKCLVWYNANFEKKERIFICKESNHCLAVRRSCEDDYRNNRPFATDIWKYCEPIHDKPIVSECFSKASNMTAQYFVNIIKTKDDENSKSQINVNHEKLITSLEGLTKEELVGLCKNMTYALDVLQD